MSKVEEIKADIESLQEDDYMQLHKWFTERDWQKWDKQISADSELGKLDFLIKEALEEKEKQNLSKL